jgi:hypothetical protein
MVLFFATDWCLEDQKELSACLALGLAGWSSENDEFDWGRYPDPCPPFEPFSLSDLLHFMTPSQILEIRSF